MSEQAQDLAPLGTPEGNAEFIARFARATILALMKPALKVSLVEQLCELGRIREAVTERPLPPGDEVAANKRWHFLLGLRVREDRLKRQVWSSMTPVTEPV